MDDLDKIKSQIDNGQGLTCAQARLLWGAYSVANRYAAYAAESYTSIPHDWLARQNSCFPAGEQGSRNTLWEIFRPEEESQ